VTREVFEERAAPGGALYVGSPQEIIDKIGREREIFGHDRLLVQIDIGGLPFDKLAGAIELYADRGRAEIPLTSAIRQVESKSQAALNRVFSASRRNRRLHRRPYPSETTRDFDGRAGEGGGTVSRSMNRPANGGSNPA
jgi:hypothetical protein